MKNKTYLMLFLAISAVCLSGCETNYNLLNLFHNTATTEKKVEDVFKIDENGKFSSKDEVALYIHTYGKLPSNYITKKDAESKGWNSQQNTMAQVLPGMSIGGDDFGNRESLLPTATGRTYKECDIDYTSGSRNAKRIVYSSDGLIFYTEDHYVTFEQLY